jgi:hypothetical protein
MKKTILSLCMASTLIALSACDTGNVQVGGGSPQSAGTAQGSSNGGGTTDNQQPGAITKKDPTAAIYFERVLIGSNAPQSIVAFSHSQIAVKGTSAWGLAVEPSQSFSANALFSLSQSSLVYLYTSNVGVDVLMSAPLDSFQATQIFSFPREVVDYSLNNDQSQVAWLDRAGALTVSNLADGKDETVDTTALPQTIRLTHVQWNSDDSFLLARSDEGSALLYKSEAAKPTVLTNVNAAAFNGANKTPGSALAYFNSTTKAMHLVDLTTMKDTVAGTLESAVIYDLSWNSSTSLSYWTTLVSQANQLRTFDVSGGAETTVALLTLPQFVGDGVVCPAWVGNKVYFGNYDSGSYVIEQTQLEKDTKKSLADVQTFAAVPNGDLNEGFVCPKVVK